MTDECYGTAQRGLGLDGWSLSDRGSVPAPRVSMPRRQNCESTPRLRQRIAAEGCQSSPQEPPALIQARKTVSPQAGAADCVQASAQPIPQKHSDCSKRKLIPHGHGDGTN
jgi:hypothetical protein